MFEPAFEDEWDARFSRLDKGIQARVWKKVLQIKAGLFTGFEANKEPTPKGVDIREMKRMDKRNIWRLRFKLVLFIIIAVVVMDFVIDALIQSNSISFIARLCWNVGIVAGVAATYFILGLRPFTPYRKG